MRPHTIVFIGAPLLTALLLPGCATAPPGDGTTSAVTTPQDAAAQAFRYRQQAAELSEMARRLELEATWYAQRNGEESEPAKRARAMAVEMRSAAAEADQLAQEYRRQVPHNQVY